MNIWDILILIFVIGWIVYTVIRLRKGKADPCSGCALYGKCDACTMKEKKF